ncbi:MAG: prepilin peptidase [Actinomycetota bacterium]
MGLAAGGLLLGLMVGAFANLVVERIPHGLALRGSRERGRPPFSPRLAPVQLGVGLVWAGLIPRIGWRSDLVAFLVFGAVLVILSAIDLKHHRLPNRILGPASILAVILLGMAALIGGDLRPFATGGIGALAYGVPILTLALIAPGDMGAGDVKFGAYLGLHLGWLGLSQVLAGMLIGFVAGGLAAAVLLATRRKSGKDSIPFGPFMALGALVVVFGVNPLASLWR